MEESEIKLGVMVSLFNWIQKSKTSGKKRSKFRKFLDAYCHKPGDYFSAIRLLLPGLDRERGSYGLKEHALATCLIDALGIARDSPDAQRLLNWRKGGPRTGATAGNFSLVAAEVLQRRQGLTSGGLTLKQLNQMLDRLSSSENRAEKSSILSDLIRETNANEMKWIIMIILKDLKLGVSEKSIFHEFHPDAEDLFNVTCDLKLVCEKLRDRSQRHKRQDIEVGKAVRPQLALRVSNVEAAWKKLHGKEVVVECKFDGDRIQLHKNNSEVHFFSRNFLDHPEYEHAMSDMIANNILADRCILDGEMLVWDTSENRFANFGSNQEIAKATREGLDGDRQMCFVAFDILYAGDTSVIHQSLRERHDLLRNVVKPKKGRLEILVPDEGPNRNRQSGESCRSFVAHSVEEVEKFFKDTVENRDEGIILKDLDSKWEPSDRSGKWLKLKPEYVRAGADLDALIIGGYYGSGRHGGKVAQFLVGLAERPMPNMHPKRFISFCRVGTGLSDEELETVVNKLQPYFIKYEYPRKAAPSFYEVTNNSKERPDVWVESPERSIILSITSDIRTIKSEVFAAPYTLRFPRIDRVRFDKPWYECLDVKSFVELVHSSNGTTQRGQGFNNAQDDKPKRAKSTKKVEKNASFVPTHFIQTDVSTVKSETLIFLKMVFYFVNVPSTHSLDLLHKMVVENGGTFSMNLNNSVTHCIAAESRGIKFQAAKLRSDVIHYSWLLDCCLLKKLLPLQPKYFLHLSEPSKKKLQEEIDENSDSYFVDVDAADIKQLLSNIDRVQQSEKIDHYKKKYCPKAKWAHFHDCIFYFILTPQSLMKSEWKVFLELVLRRMKVAVSFGGGKVTDNQHDATHAIVFSSPQSAVDYNSLLCCVTEAEKRLLMSKRIHILVYQWLEVCIERRQQVSEDFYCIKPIGEEQLASEKSGTDEVDMDKLSSLDGDILNTSSGKDESTRSQGTSKQPRLITLPRKGGESKKRGQPSGSGANREKALSTHPRRVRARVGYKPAKINENESDGSISPNHSSHLQDQTGTVESHAPADNESGDVELLKGKAVESHAPADNESGNVELLKGKAARPDASECKRADEASPRSKNGIKEDLRKKMTADPVQSMQDHLIHGLGNIRASDEYNVSEGGKLSGEVSGLDSTVVGESPALDPNQKPGKKKKVSYKDLAGELLKDCW